MACRSSAPSITLPSTKHTLLELGPLQGSADCSAWVQGQVQQLQGSSAGHAESALTHRAASLEMVRLGEENCMLAERLQQMEADLQVPPA